MIRKYFLIIALTAAAAGCMPPQGVRIDNVPMYGQPEIERPAFLKKADEDFIRKVTAQFRSREEASEIWWAEAERFMSEGNLDIAMRRYNQSWLLNPGNYQPYWGFARVMLEQGRIDEAIKFIEKAEQLNDESYQRVALLSDMGAVYARKGMEVPSYFDKADAKFAESIKLEAAYPDSWKRWAIAKYRQGKYKEAWEHVAKAESLGAVFSPKFLAELGSKMPRPQ